MIGLPGQHPPPPPPPPHPPKGHFLLATRESPGAPRVFVDAFHGGRLLGLDECREIVISYGIQWDERMVEPVPCSEVWDRMVRNLLNCCQRTGSADAVNAARELQVDFFFSHPRQLSAPLPLVSSPLL